MPRMRRSLKIKSRKPRMVLVCKQVEKSPRCVRKHCGSRKRVKSTRRSRSPKRRSVKRRKRSKKDGCCGNKSRKQLLI
jgi:hypothetical protein